MEHKDVDRTANRLLEDPEYKKAFETFFEEQLLEFVTNKSNKNFLRFDAEKTMELFRTERKVWLKNNDAFITRIGQDYRLTPDEILHLYMSWL